MSRLPESPLPTRTPHRLTMSLLGLTLLLFGSGCVSWDPIVRGSLGVWRFIDSHL